ncbi:MAG: glutathione S-transferase [Proteobacteria bacterium]|nr:MAG: glutathione S-transferase [Pseudomonadota bacterium]
MTIKLFHHPFTRAANTVWALEEVGCAYELQVVADIQGEHKAALADLNPMGKLPTIVDGEVVVSEAAAIALYLADRYAPGRLAPALDAPERATYLRWAFYAPSVIEPGCMAHTNRWDYCPISAGFGSYETMLDTISAAIGAGPWLLGERFTMADLVFGGTVQYMTMFGMLDKRPEYLAYAERLAARPAAQRAQQINQRVSAEHGLTPPGEPQPSG